MKRSLRRIMRAATLRRVVTWATFQDETFPDFFWAVGETLGGLMRLAAFGRNGMGTSIGIAGPAAGLTA
jgi:hypothetical protein